VSVGEAIVCILIYVYHVLKVLWILEYVITLLLF
jgi:hypothetical protein